MPLSVRMATRDDAAAISAIDNQGIADRVATSETHSGFREVGAYEKHARLDGARRDVVCVDRLIPARLD